MLVKNVRLLNIQFTSHSRRNLAVFPFPLTNEKGFQGLM